MSFFSIFKLSIPVLIGYVPTGIAFGLLAQQFLIPWYYAFFMSIFIYAGAAQFLAVSLFFAHASLLEIATSIFLLNLRHSFYGLSMIQAFSKTKLYKPYLIYSLTDETFALLHTLPKINKQQKARVYFWLSFLNQIYWIIGTLIGVLLGNIIKIDYKGIEFALNALFVVLAIEMYKKNPNKKLLYTCIGIGIFGIFVLPSSQMLVISLSSCVMFLLLFKRWICE